MANEFKETKKKIANDLMSAINIIEHHKDATNDVERTQKHLEKIKKAIINYASANQKNSSKELKNLQTEIKNFDEMLKTDFTKNNQDKKFNGIFKISSNVLEVAQHAEGTQAAQKQHELKMQTFAFNKDFPATKSIEVEKTPKKSVIPLPLLKKLEKLNLKNIREKLDNRKIENKKRVLEKKGGITVTGKKLMNKRDSSGRVI